jgi:hypothetical protein
MSIDKSIDNVEDLICAHAFDADGGPLWNLGEIDENVRHHAAEIVQLWLTWREEADFVEAPHTSALSDIEIAIALHPRWRRVPRLRRLGESAHTPTVTR